MNLDDYISFILSILDNLIIKISKQEKNDFNKYDKINNYCYQQNNFIFETKKNSKKQKEIVGT